MALRIDHDDRRPYLSVPRTVNLALAFQVCGLPSPRIAVAAGLGQHYGSLVSRITKGQQLATDRHLQVAARELKLDTVPGFRMEMFDESPAAFSGYLMQHGYGDYARLDGVLGWLAAIPQSGGFFLDERALKGMLGQYRGFGETSPAPADVPDAIGELGERYGVVIPVPEGAVLQAIRQQTVVALILHRQRVSGRIDMMRTEPVGGRGHIGIVSFLAGPLPDPADEALGAPLGEGAKFANCLVAETASDADGLVRAGYVIGGAAGRRDIHLFLFHPDAQPDAVESLVSRPFDADVGRRLQAAISRGLAAKLAFAARVVYDAR